MRKGKRNKIRIVGVILVLGLLSLLSPSLMATGGYTQYTWQFQDGYRGYSGTRDIWIYQGAPNNNMGAATAGVVGRFDTNTTQHKTLIKFTNLGIPSDARIQSATLSLYYDGISGSPQIAVYGLLKNFTEGTKEWGAAASGESCWNYLSYNNTAWGSAGVGLSSVGYDFAGSADYVTPWRTTTSSAPKTITNPGRYTWDVTGIFTQQQSNLKELGFLIAETSGALNTYATNYSREANPDYGSTPMCPILTVTFTHYSALEKPLERKCPQLIAFDIADALDMANNLSRVADMPFDGCKFDAVDNSRDGNGHGWLNLSVWNPEYIDYDDYSGFISNVQSIMDAQGSTLQHNFVRVCNVPGTLNPSGMPYNWENSPTRDDMVYMWFNGDFNAVLNNWRVAAQVARDSGCEGIIYDWEQYKGDIFSFAKQSDAQSLGKTLTETQARVRYRANQIMEVLNEEFPTMNLIIIPQIYITTGGNTPGDLWDSFCDGLIEAADSRMRIIDGNEKYYLDTISAFRSAYDWDYINGPAYCPDPMKYKNQVECGFGLWMNRNGWDANPEDGPLTPSQWETLLKRAMFQSDTYTWVFLGGDGLVPNWWTGVNMPSSYFTANNNARSWAKTLRGY